MLDLQSGFITHANYAEYIGLNIFYFSFLRSPCINVPVLKFQLH